MITAHITALMRAGCVTKTPSPEDGRATYILPTDNARGLVAAAQKETDDQLRHMMNVLGQKDFNALVTLITRANHILEEYAHGLE